MQLRSGSVCARDQVEHGPRSHSLYILVPGTCREFTWWSHFLFLLSFCSVPLHFCVQPCLEFNLKLDQFERAAAVKGFPEAATCLRSNPGDILSKKSHFGVANGRKCEKSSSTHCRTLGKIITTFRNLNQDLNWETWAVEFGKDVESLIFNGHKRL